MGLKPAGNGTVDRLLLPCPFCGSASVQLILKKHVCAYNGLGEPVYQHIWSVRCNVCHARGPVASARRLRDYKDTMPSWHKDDSDLKGRAAGLWNRRVYDSQTQL